MDDLGKQAKAGVNMPFYREPLETDLWFKRVELIANGMLECVEHSLRHASHLLELAPRQLRPLVGLAVDSDTFEYLLEAGDLDKAARHLVGRLGALNIESEADADVIRATIHCPALEGKVHGIGDTIAKAILNAWTTCLLRLKSRFGADLSGFGREAHYHEGRSPTFLFAQRTSQNTGQPEGDGV